MPGPTTKSNWGIGMISEDGKYKLTSNDNDVNLEPGHFVIFFTPPPPHRERSHGRFPEEITESDEKAVAMSVLYPVPKPTSPPKLQLCGSISGGSRLGLISI